MRKQKERRSYGNELTIALHNIFFHFNYNLQQKKVFWTNVEDPFKKEAHG
jgi:hypothetical protein